MEKIAVIIGAGEGLGMAIAGKFGAEGFETVLLARNEQKLKDMCKVLSERGITAHYKTADSADSSALAAAIREIQDDYGTPECVVYNVGITAPDPADLSAETLTDHFRSDVAGALTTVKSFANADFAARKGAIIFTGGGLAMYPADGFIPLSIDKAALRALAYVLNAKYEKEGIFVGTVTVCGTINACPYLAADNIAEMYWQMFSNRDRCEYAYQFADLAPEKLYEGRPVEYGMFESNAGTYWGEVYREISGENSK